MATYVTPLRAGAKLTHIGYPVTACGKSFLVGIETSHNAPANRAICETCVERATAYGWITADEADYLLCREIDRPSVANSIVALLIGGASDREVARRVGVSERTLSRYVAAAMEQIGARTRFQWGYLVGVADGG